MANHFEGKQALFHLDLLTQILLVFLRVGYRDNVLKDYLALDI